MFSLKIASLFFVCRQSIFESLLCVIEKPEDSTAISTKSTHEICEYIMRTSLPCIVQLVNRL